MSKFSRIYVGRWLYTKKIDVNSALQCYREISDDEVSHLFAASDDDQDDQLSYDEILDHHETFVGSEATDYGDHLMNLEKFKEEL
jgi:hypothetical protein